MKWGNGLARAVITRQLVSCSPKDILGRVWPVVIVGGGPAALFQINRTGLSSREVLLVAERVGSGIAFLGRQRLQSYAQELDVGQSSGSLQRFIGYTYLQPTADEYTRYVSHQLNLSGVTIVNGSVIDVRPFSNGLVIETNTQDFGEVRLRARSVVLATGTTPRRPVMDRSAACQVVYDQVYQDLQSGGFEQYQAKSILIVGSGNSALQTASLLAPVARDITILAKRYVGVYPQETPDRFAWRCLSQLTCELITKSAQRCSLLMPWFPCVRLIIYDTLVAKNGGVIFTYRRSANTSVLCRASLPPRCTHVQGQVSILADGCFEETRNFHDSIIVWAVGMEPNYPKGKTVSSLRHDDSGFLVKDEMGGTELRGLFVVGACAGARAVNEMKPARIIARNGYRKIPMRTNAASEAAAKQPL